MWKEATGTDRSGTFMPSLEAKRLEALYALEILDTPARSASTG